MDEGRISPDKLEALVTFLVEVHNRGIPAESQQKGKKNSDQIIEKFQSSVASQHSNAADELLAMFETMKKEDHEPTAEDRTKTLSILKKLQEEVKHDTATGRWIRGVCRELEGREATWRNAMKDKIEIAGEKAMSFLAWLCNKMFQKDFFKKHPEVSEDLKEKLATLKTQFEEVKGKFTEDLTVKKGSKTTAISAA